MNKIILISITCSLFALNACDHYTTRLAAHDGDRVDLSKIVPAAGGNSDMTFGQYLASEYYYMARYENDQRYDYRAAKTYTEKAESLSKGMMVGPSSLAGYKIPSANKDELARAREDLVHALMTYNIPENRYTLAMAQTRFDCWLEQQQNSKPSTENLTCQNEFKHSMATLIPPDGNEVTLVVPFDKGSMVLSEEARIAIGRAITFWKNNEGKGYQLALRPNNDLPRDETDRQIAMVRSILQFNGIPAEGIAVDYIHPASVTAPNLEKEFEIVAFRKISPSIVPDGI